jgi:hypothetical protein
MTARRIARPLSYVGRSDVMPEVYDYVYLFNGPSPTLRGR